MPIERSTLTYDEFSDQLRFHVSITESTLNDILGSDLHYQSILQAHDGGVGFILLHLKDAIAFLPTIEILFGDGWEQIYREGITRITEDELSLLKDAKTRQLRSIQAIDQALHHLRLFDVL